RTGGYCDDVLQYTCQFNTHQILVAVYLEAVIPQQFFSRTAHFIKMTGDHVGRRITFSKFPGEIRTCETTYAYGDTLFPNDFAHCLYLAAIKSRYHIKGLSVGQCDVKTFRAV